MMKTRIATLLTTTALMATVTAPHALAAQNTWTVQSSDSLWKISQATGASIQDIATANSISDPSMILDGQVLKIPAKATFWQVESGDTLWEISQATNVSVDAIAKANNISDTNLISIGAVLSIPSQTTVTVTPPPQQIAPINATPAPQSNPPVPTSKPVATNPTTQSPSPVSPVQKPVASSQADQIIGLAETFIGTPYVWGGDQPGGFDCSGFVYYAFGHFGITLPRVSTDQFNAGSAVSQSQLQKGDLVFFGDTYKPGVSHVGIYIGNGQFIQASSSKGVVISQLSNPYYTSHYYGAKRVLN